LTANSQVPSASLNLSVAVEDATKSRHKNGAFKSIEDLREAGATLLNTSLPPVTEVDRRYL
jgi:hypothetical protein